MKKFPLLSQTSNANQTIRSVSRIGKTFAQLIMKRATVQLHSPKLKHEHHGSIFIS